MKTGTNSLFAHIHDYLKVYLPKHRNLSKHTINSYREALELLVDFVKTQKQTPLAEITFEMLTANTITAFLNSLETDRGCCVSTRNTRLAAIRAFVKYAADRDISTVAVLKELKNVAVKKPDKVEIVDYMSMTAISAIVEQANAGSPSGLRDRTFLVLMYDTGARVQEMVSITLRDLRFGRTPSIILRGKGGKTRTVPLMERTVQHLQKYLAKFHPDAPRSSDFPLFYVITRNEPHPLSDRRIRYLLKDYADKAREHCSEVPENVHPHMFRHSRAMHLYQNGMDLTLVSQWLGHSNLETTQIYAHADTEHKRAAIAAATPPDTPLFSKLNPERFTVNNEEILKRLVGLR
jgi:site-specific recombinase XerD